MKFSMQGLGTAGMDLIAPFEVALVLDPTANIDDQVEAPLVFKSVARILPQRRLSGFAEFRGERVFAKLFYGKGARRYWSREIHGAALMHKAGSHTPAVLFEGATPDGEGYAVLYQAIDNPQPLLETDLEQVLAATRQIALLHDHNLMQTDIHLNNFVIGDGQLHLVDADGVRGATLLRHHFSNLACFLAQRAPWLDGDIPEVWRCYVEVRGDYVASMGSVEQLKSLTLKERDRRVQKYLDKTQRECTEFVQRKKFTRDFICDRNHWPRLQRFMVFPEIYLGEGTPLKLGNSATVVRCEIGGEYYVVKRYNIKSFSHRVRRWFKRRARNSWRNGHWLDFLGIDTAKPIALLEHRFWFFVGTSYLVMPDVGERDLGQVLSSDPDALETVAPQVATLLAHLRAAGLSHGDLKATNLIEQQSETQSRIVLIDFDAVKTGSHQKDLDRFLANWQGDPALLSAWQKALGLDSSLKCNTD